MCIRDRDYEDEEESASYLRKILKKEAFDQKGLIYGMGHAVYSISDQTPLSSKSYSDMMQFPLSLHNLSHDF